MGGHHHHGYPQHGFPQMMGGQQSGFPQGMGGFPQSGQKPTKPTSFGQRKEKK
jgi:hypothetical protein